MEEDKKKDNPMVIRLPRGDLDLDDLISDKENELKLARIIQPVVLWNTLEDRIDGNRVNTDNKLYYQTNALTSTSPVGFTVPVGESWEVIEFLCYLDTDANAANRVLSVTATGHAISTLALDLIGTSGITITANQVGGFYLNAGFSPNLFTNTNTAIAAVADENPLPLTLLAGGVIQAEYTNDQVGDVLESMVIYRKIVPESED